MRIGKIGVVIALIPFNVYGECTPAPDCASIGYTETSCEGDSLKCPFDTSKLKCMPCDSSFKYTCEGENVVSAIGEVCGGKYVSCECTTNYVLVNGSCICPELTKSECLAGTIYYPSGECSNDYVACLNPVGLMVKDNELVMSWRNSYSINWGERADITTLTSYTTYDEAKTDFEGKNNTNNIIKFGEDTGTTIRAALFCNEYAPKGLESTQGQWYLPAAGELHNYAYGNYPILLNIYKTYFGYDIDNLSSVYWSSSENDYYSAFTVVLGEETAWGWGAGKSEGHSVSCFLDIS